MATPNPQPSDLRQVPGFPTESKLGMDNVQVKVPAPERSESADLAALLISARLEAQSWKAATAKADLELLETKWKCADQSIRMACAQARNLKGIAFPDSRRFLENEALLDTALREAHEDLHTAPKLPQVEIPDLGCVPRAYAAGESFLRTVKYKVSANTLVTFLQGAEEDSPFQMPELWSLRPLMLLALVERIGEIAGKCDADQHCQLNQTAPAKTTDGIGLSTMLLCLKHLDDLDWEMIFEEVSVTEGILRLDPLEAYTRMDPESRGLYRGALAELAAHSEQSEQDIARTAVELARGPHSVSDERARDRRSHIGYYLLGEGSSTLKRAIGYKPSFFDRVQETVLRRPGSFYFTGIGLLTLAVVALFIAIPGWKALRWYELAFFVLPALECAVATMNILTTTLLPARKLPKLDFTGEIPSDCKTLVAVPMLLGSEEQVKHAAWDLEIRYLANRDTHLYFALLTDPPDSMQPFDEKDTLAAVCSKLIEGLNEKYAGDGKGSFFHLHRDRSYNASEGIWMGWERKRGKLMDLNDLLLGKGDNFSIRIGDLAVLPGIRYVITLDLDTQLPKDSARVLAGALAHPLNRAVIDPDKNIVVEGYGILQPRVEVSVKSKNRSRLAGIFSGDAGFDIYTRAVSDVYQDLFGEGIFTGKGIYEVEAFEQVLDRRFPSNAVLSHDLIEGAYARAGLISDAEVIDDYPSHVSAYSRRKHRWVRGDWQIILWLFPRVPSHSGQLVHNPLSGVSRWKIVDNLRRSLTEFALFLFLLAGWFVLPGNAIYWTLATLATMSFPIFLQSAVSLVRVIRARSLKASWENILSDFGSMQATLVFRLALLFHQSLVTLDAIVRTLVRMTRTRKRLLQWETAADAEANTRAKDPIEVYLNWTPWLCFIIDLVVVVLRPYSILVALPFLALWGSSKAICEWLNQPYWTSGNKIRSGDRGILRGAALRTWRFFRQLSNAEENWLIPDLIQEGKDALVAHRISPTNLGFLFNSRIAAFDLGWSTLTEFVGETERTFGTVERMPKHNGHFFNWYDTLTLQPLPPLLVSTVDNGNLVCCLWTLKQACFDIAKEPLFRNTLWRGVVDHLEIILELLAEDKKNNNVVLTVEGLRLKVRSFARGTIADWPDALPSLADSVRALEKRLSVAEVGEDIRWWVGELLARITALQELVSAFAPWLVPEFRQYRRHLTVPKAFKVEALSLQTLPTIRALLDKKIKEILANDGTDPETRTALELLLSSLTRSVGTSHDITARLLGIAAAAEHCAKEMDFTFLYNPLKKNLSIGYDAERNFLHNAHYDLPASEARAAVFVAIAKGEIPQEAWFQLGRPRKIYKKAGVLLSWTGTMFEYLLPSLWMKSYPNTLLEESSQTAVHVQRDFATAKNIPWGISESSSSARNPDNHYRYHAFGLPSLALSQPDTDDLVVSPYSAFLALLVDAPNAVKNLADMKAKGWLGAYGFYDAYDFTPSRMTDGQSCEMVRCWMAHHQGMILVSAASVLGDMSMQRRFHAEPMVAATERILQEKIPRTPALQLELTEDEAKFPTPPSNPPQQALLAAE